TAPPTVFPYTTLFRSTSEKGIYRTPSFSPDGSKIAYRKEGGNNDQGRTFTKNAGLYIMDANGNNPKLVTAQGEFPRFSQDGKRRSEEHTSELQSRENL